MLSSLSSSNGLFDFGGAFAVGCILKAPLAIYSEINAIASGQFSN